MRVLIGCEFSGVVREAFRRRGHDAWSCDIVPAEDRSRYHIQGDLISVLRGDMHPEWDPATETEPIRPWSWDMLIAFPPCTHLCVSGARWFHKKRGLQTDALEFVRRIMSANVPQIAVENPVGIISTHVRPADQIIQPWQFGHGETKATCLWLKGLPRLQPTNIVEGREARIHKMPPSPDRGMERSRTYPGIADAMAEQWGNLGEWSLTA